MWSSPVLLTSTSRISAAPAKGPIGLCENILVGKTKKTGSKMQQTKIVPLQMAGLCNPELWIPYFWWVFENPSFLWRKPPGGVLTLELDPLLSFHTTTGRLPSLRENGSKTYTGKWSRSLNGERSVSWSGGWKKCALHMYISLGLGGFSIFTWHSWVLCFLFRMSPETHGGWN